VGPPLRVAARAVPPPAWKMGLPDPNLPRQPCLP